MKYIIFPQENLTSISQEILNNLHIVPRIVSSSVVMKIENYEKLFPGTIDYENEIYPYPVYSESDIPGITLGVDISFSTMIIPNDNKYSIPSGEYTSGLILKYKDPTKGWTEYLWDGSKWINFSNYCEVDYSNIKHYPTYYLNDGSVGKSVTQFSTYFIKITEGDYVYYKNFIGNTVSRIFYFDENFSFITYSGTTSGLEEGILTPSSFPEGTTYISFNHQYGMDPFPNPTFKVFSKNASLDLSKKILDLSEKVNEDYMEIGHKEIATWETDNLDPRASYDVGDREIANKESIFLVEIYQDVSGNNKVRIVGELQKNNLFKFKNGEYAPTVVITQTDYDATNIDLYSDPTHTNLVYQQGSYNATEWWLNNGKTEKPLYDIYGAKVYCRKPWETLDKGYDIVIGWKDTFWMFGGEFDDSGNTIFGFFDKPAYFRGFLPREVEPTGYCLDLPTLYGGKLRCMYFKDTGGSMSAGKGSFFDVRRTNRAYPRTGVSQLSAMIQARARNIGDVQSSIPVCEGMGFHKLSHIYSRYIKYLRYDLHQDSLWGPGISSNISPNSTTWDKYSGGSGIKFSMNGGNPDFHTFSSGPNITWSSGSTTTTDWSNWIDQNYPKGRTLEAQMALSWAVEKGIEPEIKFTWDEEEYVYTNIPHLHTLLEGPDMNARLFKWTDFSGEPYEKGSTNKVVVTGQMKLQWPVCDGMVLWGDVFDLCGGIEVVVDVVTPTSSGTHRYTNPFIAYLCTSQKNLMYLNSSYTSGGGFGFEGTYEKIGEGIRNGARYPKNLFPYSIVPVAESGGTLYTGPCAHSTNFDNSGDTVFSVAGRKVRAIIRGRGYASWNNDSARHWNGYLSMSNMSAISAASLQVALS